ncbi:Uncharacterised protein [Segatella buccae]|jgi:hypothetical protein|uniref:Uncharacterized protein n=2 Tax=Segatella buccae TaxID=28126 RepID=E6K4G7_9BACT|nr:hypothetical protein HMPREF6485_0469 [Segatella buccae ATCC 33574]EJP31447.1 hypothetical protein HMPREF1146_2056 [Prevotella sp. MSX73]SUB80473.1 Uncharacterised protein [Segatella buccae]
MQIGKEKYEQRKEKEALPLQGEMERTLSRKRKKDAPTAGSILRYELFC